MFPSVETVQAFRRNGHKLDTIADMFGIDHGKFHGWYAAKHANGKKAAPTWLEATPENIPFDPPEPVATPAAEAEAEPKPLVMTSTAIRVAKRMKRKGFSRDEIAKALRVPANVFNAWWMREAKGKSKKAAKVKKMTLTQTDLTPLDVFDPPKPYADDPETQWIPVETIGTNDTIGADEPAPPAFAPPPDLVPVFVPPPPLDIHAPAVLPVETINWQIVAYTWTGYLHMKHVMREGEFLTPAQVQTPQDLFKIVKGVS